MNDDEFETAIESAMWLEAICMVEVVIVFGTAIAATFVAAWLW